MSGGGQGKGKVTAMIERKKWKAEKKKRMGSLKERGALTSKGKSGVKQDNFKNDRTGGKGAGCDTLPGKRERGVGSLMVKKRERPKNEVALRATKKKTLAGARSLQRGDDHS